MDVFWGFAFEGAETVAGRGCMMGAIAVALRGDRGLEPLLPHNRPAIVKLRSLFGAIEDWNMITAQLRDSRHVLRSLFGAIEDWNP